MRASVRIVVMSLALVLLNGGCGGKSDDKKSPEQKAGAPVQVREGPKGKRGGLPPLPPPPEK